MSPDSLLTDLHADNLQRENDALRAALAAAEQERDGLHGIRATLELTVGNYAAEIERLAAAESRAQAAEQERDRAVGLLGEEINKRAREVQRAQAAVQRAWAELSAWLTFMAANAPPALNPDGLKPCPFCGGAARKSDNKYDVYCQACGVRTGVSPFEGIGRDVDALRAARWNRRAFWDVLAVSALQPITALEWDCPCPHCRDTDPDTCHWRGEYEGSTICMVDVDDPDTWHEIDLPDGVVLARDAVATPPAQQPYDEERAALLKCAHEDADWMSKATDVLLRVRDSAALYGDDFAAVVEALLEPR